MLKTRTIMTLVGALALLLAACASAATPTAAPATATPTRVAAATATPTVPPPGGGATPQPTATPAPTAVAAAGPKYGGTIRVVAISEADRFDRQAHYAGDNTLTKSWDKVFSKPIEWEWPKAGDPSCFIGLYNDAAESWQWRDGTLEIKLRPGMKFHNKPPVNGREVTADDLAWSLNRVKQVQLRFQEYLEPIKEIKAVDKYTVQLVGKEPLPAIIYGVLASFYGATPVARESAGPDGTWNNPYKSWIGTGPFMFKEWRPGVKLVFERNPDYHWKGKPYVDRVEESIMPDSSTRLAVLRAGKLDWADFRIGITQVDGIRGTNPEIRVLACPGVGGIGTIQIRNDLPPWNDVRVRRALFLAIDQDAIIKSVLQSAGFPSGAVLHTMPLGLTSREDYPPEVRKYLYPNPAEAKRLLAEAGFPSGFKTTLEVSRYYGSPWSEAAEAVSSMLQAAGIRAEMKWLERVPFSARFGKQDALMIKSATAPTPWHIVRRYLCESPPEVNNSRICDPEVDKIISEFLVTTAEKRQRELIRDLEIRLVDQAFSYSLPAPMYYMMGQPWVKNFEAAAGQDTYEKAFYDNVWLDR